MSTSPELPDPPPEVEVLPRISLPADGAPGLRLERGGSPLGQMHEGAGRLGDPYLRGDTHRVDHLYGPHGLKFPVMALLVRRHMGPVRHALSQRTVAGGLQIIYAPGDRPAVPPPPPDSSPPTKPSPTPATR